MLGVGPKKNPFTSGWCFLLFPAFWTLQYNEMWNVVSHAVASSINHNEPPLEVGEYHDVWRCRSVTCDRDWTRCDNLFVYALFVYEVLSVP